MANSMLLPNIFLPLVSENDKNKENFHQYLTVKPHSRANGAYKVKDMSIKINSKRSPHKIHRVKIYYKLSKCQTQSFVKSPKKIKNNNFLRIKQIRSTPAFHRTNSQNSKVNYHRIHSKNSHTLKSRYLLDRKSMSLGNFSSHLRHNPIPKTCWNVYQCQLSTVQKACCSSCNSDAMFEVMKNLYDCYKKKNCDNCSCILCGHLPREETRLGEMHKSNKISIQTEDEEEALKGKAKVKKTKVKSLEGKSAAENILKNVAKSGALLPEGKTKSEKDMIKKLTPLYGKSSEQNEKILRHLAMNGFLLLKHKSSTEKKIIEKVRNEVYKKVMKAGVITPLENNTISKKKTTLRKQAELGLPLPEGCMVSEKASIVKVKADALRKAKAEDLLTPLSGETPKQKEKILKCLAINEIPLPEGKTPSEKKLINKIRKDFGLPPEPETTSAKEMYNKGYAAGVMTPLLGKTDLAKEKILQNRTEMGILLPERSTSSEKTIINQIKKEVKPISLSEVKVLCAKLRKAQAESLLTLMDGKTPELKVKILRGTPLKGITISKSKTPSENKLIDKVRKKLCLSLEPSTSSGKKIYDKAMAAGDVVLSLEGKSVSDKETILRMQAEMLERKEGVSPVRTVSKAVAVGRSALLPETRKKLDNDTEKLMKELKGVKLKQANAANLLTSLEGKTPKKQQKILKRLVKAGIPLPEGKTLAEKELIQKVRSGLSLEPKIPSMKKNMQKPHMTGIILLLKGKSAAQREKIFKKFRTGPCHCRNRCLCLSKGRTHSEKALIKKIQSTPISEKKTPFQKLKQAKALLTPLSSLTPLQGKTPKKQKKALKGLVKAGLPVPEGNTLAEKDLIQKVRRNMSLPSEPKTQSMIEKTQKTLTPDVITPLKGKLSTQTMREMAIYGIPLPEGKTASGKYLINKICANIGLPLPSTTPLEGRTIFDKLIAKLKATAPSESHVPSEKLRKSKAAGLLTQLECKPKEKKEEILQKLAKAGLPLPEGKTPSEKSQIHKIRTEFGKVKTPFEKEVVRKTKTEGILTPLKGKLVAQKEKILNGLAVRMRERKIPSEKALIQTAAGLPLELNPSETKGMIKTKSIKICNALVKKITKGIGVTKSKAGISKEFQDIIKTTTCDRGCGCDKKKIRFKHSYVTIRVTSPDISSLCPCPDVPGVKGGVFIDNEGIKVTVGRVGEIISFPSKQFIYNFKGNLYEKYSSSSNFSITSDGAVINIVRRDRETHDSSLSDLDSNKLNLISKSDVTKKTNSVSPDKFEIVEIANFSRNSWDCGSYTNVFSTPSLQSLYAIKTESSLSFSSSVKSMSVLSFFKSEFSSDSDIEPHDYSVITSLSCNKPTNYFHKDNDIYIIYQCPSSRSSNAYNSKSNLSLNNDGASVKQNISANNSQVNSTNKHDVYILRYTESKQGFKANNLLYKTALKVSPDVMNEITNNPDIPLALEHLITEEALSISSLVIIVPTLSEDRVSEGATDTADSTICIQLSEHQTRWRYKHFLSSVLKRNLKGFKTTRISKLQSKTSLNALPRGGKDSFSNISKEIGLASCLDTHRRSKDVLKMRCISTDTLRTDTTPCRCVEKAKSNRTICCLASEKPSNVMSEVVNPFMAKDALAQGLDHNLYMNIAGKDITSCSRVSFGSTQPAKQTPIRVCKMSPRTAKKPKKTGSPAANFSQKDPFHEPNLSELRSCTCSPEKLKEPREPAKEMVSTACGSSFSDIRMRYKARQIKKNTRRPRHPTPSPKETSAPVDTPCNACYPPPVSKRSDTYYGTAPKIHNKFISPEPEARKPSKLHVIKSVNNDSCPCNYDRRKKRTKHNCECQSEFDPFGWIDEKTMRQMKSDLTQTISGFKITVPRKSNANTEMRFEDAPRYVAQYYEDTPAPSRGGNNQMCACNAEGKSFKNKTARDCPCADAPLVLPEEPITGIKFHIEGKGSGNRGISGFFCFELSYDQTGSVK